MYGVQTIMVELVIAADVHMNERRAIAKETQALRCLACDPRAVGTHAAYSMLCQQRHCQPAAILIGTACRQLALLACDVCRVS